MNRTIRRGTLATLLLVLALGSTGCVDGLVADTARSSLASFLTTLASTAINHVVNSN